MDRNYFTNFGLDTIKNAIRGLACDAGIEHRDWFNPGSTWYGEARRVRNMARITVSLNKYGRAQIFGPGTMCRSEWSTAVIRDHDVAATALSKPLLWHKGTDNETFPCMEDT